MSDPDDDLRLLARYGLGAARLYLWLWIGLSYFLAVVFVPAGMLIIADGSTGFGLCTMGLGLVAWMIAGRLRRFKNEGR